MKISLLHPSRGRALKAKETFDYWMRQASGENEIEHILSLDFDDAQKMKYVDLFPATLTLINPNNNVVEATNKAAEVASGDILIYTSDDFKVPYHWDIIIFDKIKHCINECWMLKVDDCLQQFDVDVATIPIMSISLYKRLGYFFNPDFKSMFVDQHLYWVCKNNGWLIEAPELKFPHEHYSIGKATLDETYKRSDLNWNQGKEMYSRYRQAGFPIKLT